MHQRTFSKPVVKNDEDVNSQVNEVEEEVVFVVDETTGEIKEEKTVKETSSKTKTKKVEAVKANLSNNQIDQAKQIPKYFGGKMKKISPESFM